jgi:hypothetical protein
MYVNSPEGLRGRKSPDITGEIIAVLNDLTKVKIIKEDDNYINIDEIRGKWVFVSSDNIEGWVFNGYLSHRIVIKPEKIIKNGIEITGDVILLNFIIPSIENRAIGTNDDIEIKNDDIIEADLHSLLITLTNNNINTETVILRAKNNNNYYDKLINLDVLRDYKNEIIGYYQYLKFENLSWVFSNNNWTFYIIDSKTEHVIFEKQLVLTTVNNILFREYSDSPFNNINLMNYPSNIFVNETIKYRYDLSQTDYIVIYWNNGDYNIYEPVIVMHTVNDTNELTIIFNENAAKGIYTIRNYTKDSLPQNIINIPIYYRVYLK